MSLSVRLYTHTDGGEGQAREGGCLYPHIRGFKLLNRGSLPFSLLLSAKPLRCFLPSVEGLAHSAHLQVRWKSALQSLRSDSAVMV